jgi:hypothetical protein
VVEVELQLSIAQGLIAANIQTTDAFGTVTTVPSYYVTSGLVADLPANQRADRQAPDIVFEARLEGAVHKISIRGNIEV